MSVLLAAKADPAQPGGKAKEVPLYYAASSGHAGVVGLLLDANVDPNAVGESSDTALHAAAKNGHHAAVSLLLERRANPDSRNKSLETPLHLAAKTTHANVVEALLDARASRLVQTVQFALSARFRSLACHSEPRNPDGAVMVIVILNVGGWQDA